MFGATKSSFSDVSFEQLNIDDPNNADLVQRYDVRGVPRVVFLDSSSKVLFNDTPVIDAEGWAGMIRRYH